MKSGYVKRKEEEDNLISVAIASTGSSDILGQDRFHYLCKISFSISTKYSGGRTMASFETDGPKSGHRSFDVTADC